MAGHVNNSVKLHNRGECLDNYANHFAKELKKGDATRAKKNRETLKVRVIKKCNSMLISKKMRVMNANYEWKKG